MRASAAGRAVAVRLPALVGWSLGCGCIPAAGIAVTGVVARAASPLRRGFLAGAEVLVEEIGERREGLVGPPERLQVPQAGQHDRRSLGQHVSGHPGIPRCVRLLVLTTYNQGRGLHMREICPRPRLGGPRLPAATRTFPPGSGPGCPAATRAPAQTPRRPARPWPPAYRRRGPPPPIRPS